MSLLTPTESPSDNLEPARSGGVHFWLLGIRMVIAIPMIYYQSWTQALNAWGFVWEERPWSIADKFVELGIPQPEVFSATLIFLLLVSPFGLLIGFLTRINALVTFLCVLFVLVLGIDQEISQWLNAQVLVLYMGMCVILTLSGGGLFTFDALLTRRRGKKTKKQVF